MALTLRAENPDDEWRVESDGVGELHLFFPECWERERRPVPGSAPKRASYLRIEERELEAGGLNRAATRAGGVQVTHG